MAALVPPVDGAQYGIHSIAFLAVRRWIFHYYISLVGFLHFIIHGHTSKIECQTKFLLLSGCTQSGSMVWLREPNGRAAVPLT